MIEPRNARQVTEEGAIKNVSVSATSWSACADLGVREWVDHGRRLGAVGRSVGWWVGDWLMYGNEHFGERYPRGARITGYDTQTLMNMVYVASRFDVPRRRAGLSFSHHAELAALDPDEQDYWLARAEAERLSVRCLRQELRSHRKALKDNARSELVAAPVEGDEMACSECGRPFDSGYTPRPDTQLVKES